MKRMIPLLLAFMMLFSLAACNKTGEPSTPDDQQQGEPANNEDQNQGEEKTPEPQKIDGGHFVMCVEESITTTAWYNVNSSTLGMQTFQPAYDPLWYVTSGGETKPMIAESYELSEDGTTYTIHLRQNAYWHDGEQITADDFIYTLDWFQDPDCGAVVTASRFKVDGEFCGYEKVDDFTVKVTISRPSNFFTEKIGSTVLLPEHVFKDVPAAEVLTTDKHVGNGAFVISEFVPGEKVVMKRNENYYRGKASIETLEVRFVTNTASQEVAFRNGELSIYHIINAETLATFENDENYNLYSFSAGAINFLALNPNGGTLSDIKARQAVINALNLDEILQGAFGSEKLSHVANSVQCANGLFYNPSTENYKQDVETAKQLVQETGLADKTIRIMFNSARANNESIAIMIESQLNAVGLKCEINSMETSGYFTAYFRKSDAWDLALMSVDSMGDPGNYAGMYNSTRSGANMAISEEVNELWTTLDKEIDPAKRQTLVDEINAKLKDCWTTVPVSDANYVFAAQPNVRGFDETDDVTSPLFRDWLDIYFVG